jgi:hypothetical protein
MFDRVIKIKVPHKSKYGWALLDTQKGKYRRIQLPRSGQEFKVEFIGNSRIDGNPMFSLLSTGQISFDSIKSIITHWRFTQAFSDLGNEFELVEKFEDVMASKVDIEFTECNNHAINQWMNQWLKASQSEIDKNQALERNELEPVRTVARDLVPVRPMSLPSGLLYYIDYVYGETRYNLTEQQLKYLLLSL